jgi:hypothetical protein
MTGRQGHNLIGHRPANKVGYDFDPKTMTKQFELRPGTWAFHAGVRGHIILGLFLIDIRRRRIPLTEIEYADFKRIAQLDDKGKPKAPAVHLRGVPIYYARRLRGWDSGLREFIYLWPAPLQAWRLEIQYDLRDTVRFGKPLQEIERPGWCGKLQRWAGEGDDDDEDQRPTGSDESV